MSRTPTHDEATAAWRAAVHAEAHASSWAGLREIAGLSTREAMRRSDARWLTVQITYDAMMEAARREGLRVPELEVVT